MPARQAAARPRIAPESHPGPPIRAEHRSSKHPRAPSIFSTDPPVSVPTLDYSGYRLTPVGGSRPGRGAGPAPAGGGAYRVLANTPGLRLLGPVKDSIGRVGTGIAVRIRPVEMGMIVDPSTGALLEADRRVLYRSREFLTRPPGLFNRSTYVSHAVAQSTHG